MGVIKVIELFPNTERSSRSELLLGQERIEVEVTEIYKNQGYQGEDGLWLLVSLPT